MKQILHFLFILSSISVNTLTQNHNQQHKDIDEKFSTINDEIIEYFRSKNYLTEHEKHSWSPYVMDFLDYKEYTSINKSGVFLFGYKSSHPIYVFVFINNNHYQITELTNIEDVLTTLVHFFKQSDIKNETIKMRYTVSLMKALSSMNQLSISEEFLPIDWDVIK
ncbi:hypothetical protein MY04_3210 [Flammeovirga sp. MY04]|uniref:hypothetical protein n=1 Tax=Flammeovirga sp. MY04 TaxID=1191459 RepID=UPI00080624D9|nr:hypothetical protein [Flammeovirga sp. MY04]ANQ50575.1 hypothetical protein MY04_3210 [Flammeovirga sp. MY04]